MTVKVRIASNLNISFNHTLDTEIEPEEWAEMSNKEQDEIIQQMVWDVLDVWTEGEED